MSNKLLDDIRTRYVCLQKYIDSLEERLNSFPEGNLKIKKSKSGSYYSFHNSNTSIYLGKKDATLIHQLVQKKYVANTIKAAKQEADILKKAISGYPQVVAEDIYDLLPEARKKYATPVFFTDEECAKNWLSIPFKPKPFSKNSPSFITAKGERVRSKSEVIIADRLYAKGIPYKYECPLFTGSGVIHPDFTILRLSDRKILYHEHCGKMGDPGYVIDMLDRVNVYAREKLYIGDRLFFTFESEVQPFDAGYLDDFIEKNYR